MPELLDGTKHIPWFKAGELIFTKGGIQYLGINGANVNDQHAVL